MPKTTTISLTKGRYFNFQNIRYDLKSMNACAGKILKYCRLRCIKVNEDSIIVWTEKNENN